MTKSSSGSRRRGAPRSRAEGAESAPPVAGGRTALRQARRKSGRRRVLNVVGLAMGFVLLLGIGTAAYAYWKLTSGIKSDELSANGKDGAGHETPDAFGRSPINILVIGSDARATASDCKLGGACGTAGGARADVEMVVHISADRSNATVMSIPRDLRSSWNGCHAAHHPSMGPQSNQMINSALEGGPGCSVVAVHELTGIPIDHFMMVDFSGVVTMSRAVGGVPICVDHDIYDPYSHLKLKEGPHVLEGQAALEFVRTRHGFGDSSDSRGRTAAQHIFLSSLLNQLKTKGTLSSPTRMWAIANAATQSLTVDSSLNSPTKLVGLAGDLNKVPANRVTFATMQTHDLKVNGVWQTLVTNPGANNMFKSIANDQSLTAAASPASPSIAPAATAVATSAIAVQVQNGTTVHGRANTIAQELLRRGFSERTAAVNGTPATATSLAYPAGHIRQAKAVAEALGLPVSVLKQQSGTGIVLVIGTDWPSGTSFPGSKTAPAPVDTQATLDGANVKLGNDNATCAQVSTFKTAIGLDASGKPTSSDRPTSSTTPTRAYALSPEVKDSAP
ncbi:LCP family protein [Streptomyces sp. NPDC093228]|uniref:LCP family protein n=1 Tax=Streptomyces sp. NPDC093228 TaxID=3155070 RepID=UPI00343EBE6D